MFSLSRLMIFWFSSQVSLLCMVTRASWHSMKVDTLVLTNDNGSLLKEEVIEECRLSSIYIHV